MRTVGFTISEKENEERRAVILNDLNTVKNKKQLFFQKGYGEKIGFSNEELIEIGCNVCDKDEILKCDVICEPKIGDSPDIARIQNKIIFGWIHATQNYDIAQICIDNKLTVYAWEKMFDGNRHVFYKNNQIAGQAAVLHAMLNYGRKFSGLEVAVLGNGNTAIGAINILSKIGANIEIFSREHENTFKKEMSSFDVIVNCVLWDVTRKDHIIFREDLKNLKKGALIIDVSCDKNGAIETSVPTTIDNPIYTVNGIYHYVVDHTPTLLYKDASETISKEIVKYLDDIIEEKNNVILNNALIIKDGIIIDDEINKYQNRAKARINEE